MANGTIMIVEDDDNDLLLIRMSLQKADIDNPIVMAQDGVEALQLLLDGPQPLAPLPTIVLLDIKLPRMDGLEVLQRLRSEDRTRGLPVVLLTSSDEQEDLVRGYQYGVNSYVRKPSGFDDFRKTIGQLGAYWTLVNRLPYKA